VATDANGYSSEISPAWDVIFEDDLEWWGRSDIESVFGPRCSDIQCIAAICARMATSMGCPMPYAR
jgi:hypothetical protein